MKNQNRPSGNDLYKYMVENITSDSTEQIVLLLEIYLAICKSRRLPIEGVKVSTMETIDILYPEMTVFNVVKITE